MKVDASLESGCARAVSQAKQYESDGYDGVFTTEAGHDPFLPLGAVALETNRVEIGTAIAVAFAHSPLSLAQVAHDLQVESQGRCNLGLGSQVKAHVTRRYSMEWGQPAARMRELILAMRAVWSSWNDGVPLKFLGDFYQHTLMPPFFSPAPSPFGPPKVFLAGVNVGMTTVAGEVADGFLAHPFTTERYLRQVTGPALEEGHGRREAPALTEFEVSLPVFIVTGATEEATAASAVRARQQIAFYASTAAYRPVLALHGWEDLQGELAQLVRTGDTSAMLDLVDNNILSTFAIVAEPDEVARAIRERFDGIVQRISVYEPHANDQRVISSILEEFADRGNASRAATGD
jgi:probable F420-dependent oxidoreductase